MMSPVTRTAYRLLGLALVALLTACGETPTSTPKPAPAPKPEPAEWVKPYDGWLPDTAPENTAVVRVLDERTGQPIRGAVVRRHLEMEMGPAGWGPSYEEATTDEHGIAVIPIVEQRPWSAHWVVHAEGFGSDETYGVAPNEEVELLPGRNVHGRIVDAMGRAAAGIPIGYKLGCGHAPSVYDTTTDAEGRFVLRNVTRNGDVSLSGPGVLVDYYRAALRRLDETPDVHAADAAVRVTGRVVGADVADLSPRIIHSQSTTRGVAARIQDDGTFVLDGVARESMLDLYWAPEGKGQRIDSGLYHLGRPLIWDVREHGDEEDGEDEDAGKDEEIPWRVVTPDGTDAVVVDIHAYRAHDGREADHEYTGHGDTRSPLLLPPGEYDVVVGDATSRWVAPSRRFVVEAGKPQPLVVQATEQPRLVVQWNGKEPEKCTYSLAFARPDGRIDHEHIEIDGDGEEDPVHLPAAAPARVRVQMDEVTRYFDVGPAADGRRVAVLEWVKPTKLRFEAPADVARVVLGGYEHEFVRRAGAIELVTPLAGRVRLHIARSDEYHELDTGERLIDLPPPAGQVLRLDPLAYAAAPVGEITLLDADGKPRTNVDVDVSWFNPVTRELEQAELATDAHGDAQSQLLRTGARVMWNSRSRIDHDRVLNGAGPWTLRTGAARLALDVRGPDGALREAAVLFSNEVLAQDNDDFDSEADDGRFTFDTLRAGAYRLVIAAPGHRSQERRIVLAEGQRRTIEVLLEKSESR